MKKANKRQRDSDMADHYDLTGGVRGKYAARLAREGSNLILLDSDVAEVFRTSEAVNTALRRLAAERRARSNVNAKRRRKAG